MQQKIAEIFIKVLTVKRNVTLRMFREKLR
jgi:hypothetical protein